MDGFHRYRVMLEHEDIYEREHGMLPVSVIDKPLDQRMASTIRHNRARGRGMDRDEVLRLKQITGLAALFKDVKFGKAWRPAEEEEPAEAREKEPEEEPDPGKNSEREEQNGGWSGKNTNLI